jgi:hypothetical protein
LFYALSAHAGVGGVSFNLIVGPGLSNGLFATIGTPTTQPGMTSWPVTVDIGALGTLPASLLLNLPGRDSVMLTRDISENRGPSRFLWTGRGGDCTAALDATPDEGLRGSLSCVNANYGFSGTAQALELDRYDPNPSGPPAGTEDAPVQMSGEDMAVLESDTMVPFSPTVQDNVIDVLVLYQEPVRAHFDPAGGTLHTRAFAQRCVDTLRAAVANSLSTMKVQMVAAKEVSRTTYGSVDADLTWLQSDPEPKGLRNFWAADVVMYLTYYGGGVYYGTSIIPGATNPPNPPFPPPGSTYAPLAEAVVQYNTAIEDTTQGNINQPFVFLHEFAHVVGANHNHEDAPNTTPLEGGAFGYWRIHAKKGSARTIMSNTTMQCRSAGDCTRLMYYSNPDVIVDGWFHTGQAGYANNAQLLSDYWTITAQYRQSLGRIFYDGFDP